MHVLVRTTMVALTAALAVAPAAHAAPPTVSFDGGAPANGTVYSSGTTSAYPFTVTSDVPSTETCTLTEPDNTPVVTNACASPWSAAGLTQEGLYTLTVDTVNVDGSDSASRSFYVDTSAPTGSFTSGPANNHIYASDPGTISFGFSITDTVTPVTITCAVSGPTSTGPDPCTNSFDVTTSGDGTYTVSVVATDGAGHVFTLSRSFIVDTIAPTFIADPDFSPQPSPLVSSSLTPTFTWSATDANGPVTFTCEVNGGSPSSCNSGDSFSYTDGTSRSLTVIAQDAAGHTTSKTVTFTVDTTAPSFSANPNFTPQPTTGITSSSQPTFTWTTNDLTTVTYECKVDGVSVGACTSGYQTAVLADGNSHTFEVIATDLAGNSTNKVKSFTVDTTPPSFTTNLTLTPESPAGYTNTVTPSFTWATSDLTLVTYKCKVNGGTAFTCNSGWVPTYTDGAGRTFSVTATDQAGNQTTQSKTFFVDSVKPTATVTSASPHGHTANDVRDRQPDFALSVSDPSPSSGSLTMECRIDGAVTWDDCTGGTYHAPSALQEGPHTLHVRATDLATNTRTTDYAFNVDITDPIPSPNIPDGTNLVLHQSKTVTCTDPLGENSYASGVYTCIATIDGTSFPTGSAVPTHSDDFGYHTIDVTATDEAGNDLSTNEFGPDAHYVVNAGSYLNAVNGFSPTGFWRGNDAPGSSMMADSSGNNHAGTWTKGVARPRTGPEVDTTINTGTGATELSGANAYGYVNGISAGDRAYTMDIWVKPTSTTEQSIYGHGSGAGEIYIDANGRFAFRHPGVTVEASTVAIDTSGVWYHLMATWSRGSNDHLPGTATLYVQKMDAQMLAANRRTFTGTSSTNASGAAALYIGNGEQAGAHSFRGTVADAAYWTGTALSAHDFTDLSRSMVWVNLGIRADNNDWTPPTVSITSPADGDSFQTTKAPGFTYGFSCDDFEGAGDVVSCDATVDGVAVSNADPVTSAGGSHTLTVTATDNGGGITTRSIQFHVGTYSSVIAADSPLAYWRLDEGSAADTLVDVSGNGHDGGYKWDPSNPGTAQGGTGISGDGNATRDFFGRGAYAYVNGIGVSDVGLTEEIWVKVDDPARDQAIIEHGGAGLLSVRGGLYRFVPNTNASVEVTGTAPTGGFDHVVGTWDGITARLYVNGDLKDSAEAATPPPSGAATFYFGRSNSALGELHGSIDEAAYWTSALSAHQVYLHYRADPPPPATAAAAQHTADSSAKPATTAAAGKAKAKARSKAAKVKAAQRALTLAKAKLHWLTMHHASTKSVARARAAVRAKSRALAKLRRA